jgi:hypothetical protein
MQEFKHVLVPRCVDNAANACVCTKLVYADALQ